MNSTFQSIRVGLFFVLGLALIYTVYSVIGSKSLTSDEGYGLTTVFDNIRTLTPGTDVRMAGVRIGEVTETTLKAGRGEVRLRINEGVEIPSDSIATIAMASLLGQNYLSVDYGKSSVLLTEGDELLAEDSPDLNTILKDFEALGEGLDSALGGFSGLGGEGLGELIENLNGLVSENRGRVDTILVNLEEITTKLSSGEGTLGRLINEDDLYVEAMAVVGDLRSSAEELRTSLGGTRDLIDRVQAGEGTLGRLLVDDTIANELETTVANLRAFSEDLKNGEGTLGKLVSDDTLYTELRGILNKADQALDSVGDSGPITSVGALSGALF
jgi:phospholipid/cholesterol/gamma-HCH transport system substrate-binding protein